MSMQPGIYEKIRSAFTWNLLPVEKRSPVYDIVLSLDNRLVDAIFVLMSSMKRNLSRKVRLWILQSDFNPVQRAQLILYSHECDIELHIIDENIEQYAQFNSTRLPRQTYFYLNACNLLPKDIDRALILDMDTLILKDISRLYDIDFEGAYLAAGNEYEHIKFADHMNMYAGTVPFRRGDLLDSEAYFNSGVILLNLAKLRAENVDLNSFKAILVNSDQGSFFHDQIIINRFAKGNVKIFPRLYFNCCAVYREFYQSNFHRENRDNLNEVYLYNPYDPTLEESIIHYTAKDSIKPWAGVKDVDQDGALQYRKTANDRQLKYVYIWWDYAKSIPVNVYYRMLLNSIRYNASKNDTKYHKLESELDYFRKYVSIFRSLIETPGNLNNLITYLKSKNIKRLGFYRMNQVLYALVPFLRENGLSIDYVVENYTPDCIERSIPVNSPTLPPTDLLVVMDVKNDIGIANKLRSEHSFPIVGIFELVSQVNALAANRGK